MTLTLSSNRQDFKAVRIGSRRNAFSSPIKEDNTTIQRNIKNEGVPTLSSCDDQKIFAMGACAHNWLAMGNRIKPVNALNMGDHLRQELIAM